MLGNFSCFCCRLLTFFKKLSFSKNSFRNTFSYQSVKHLGSRSGPTFCRSWSGSKLFAKVISWKQVTMRRERMNFNMISDKENVSREDGSGSYRTGSQWRKCVWSRREHPHSQSVWSPRENLEPWTTDQKGEIEGLTINSLNTVKPV